MFLKLGGLLDRAGWHFVTIIGTVGLALISAFNAPLLKCSVALTIILTIVSAVLSVCGVIVGVRSYERRSKSAQAQILTGLGGTLTPAAASFIDIAPTVDDSSLTNALTELTARCAQFVKSEADDTPDANIYLLDGTTLRRANRSAGTARLEFKKQSAVTKRALEESAVIARVLAQEVCICDDVKDPENQEKLCLEKTERKYRAFISVPIVIGDVAVGMISVNSARKNHLTAVHVAFLERVAELVAALIAVKRRQDMAQITQDEA